MSHTTLNTIPATTERQRWFNFLNYGWLILGTSHLLVGIFFFFAYNWNDLGDITKFIIVQSLLIIGLIAVTILNLKTLSGKILLMATALVIGALFALFGQVYQSPADSYTLFLTWAVAILGWVILSNFAALWLFWLGLLNLTAMLYWEQFVSNIYSSQQSPLYFTIVCCLNLLAFGVWTYLRKNKHFAHEEWAYTIFAIVPIGWLTYTAIDIITDSQPAEYNWWYWLFYIIVSGLIWFYFRVKEFNLAILTVVATSVNICITAWYLHTLFDRFSFGTGWAIIIGIMLLAQSMITLKILQEVSQRQKNVQK